VSAVILAVIVVMWAVVLVPMWLRRHEATSETRSADKFSAAMRVLSRRSQSSPDRRYVLMPRRESSVSVHVSGAPAVPKRITANRPAARERVRPTLAARRRRTFLVLLGIVGLTFVLAIAGVFPVVIQVLADLALLAFVVHLRLQARRAAEIRRRRGVASRPAPASQPDRVAPRWAATASEPMIDLAAAEAEAAPVAIDLAATDPHGWEPIPVPRPTYTMKPAAPAVSRPPAAAAAAGQPVVAESVDAPAEEGDYEYAEPSELDEILERRWAVND
jgi:hypothetical protein